MISKESNADGMYLGTLLEKTSNKASYSVPLYDLNKISTHAAYGFTGAYMDVDVVDNSTLLIHVPKKSDLKIYLQNLQE